MTIPISEVLLEAARVCDSVSHENPMTASDCAEAIRALAAKYEGDIVAEGKPEVRRYQLLVEDQVVNERYDRANWDVRHKPFGRYDVDHGGTVTKTPLYRAKEPRLPEPATTGDMAVYRLIADNYRKETK